MQQIYGRQVLPGYLSVDPALCFVLKQPLRNVSFRSLHRRLGFCRFKHLPVVKENLVRFYAGTPIVSSRGHRLGTVCFACDEPRKFDAEGCTMLTNMGELVTRELEREWAARQQAKSLNSASSVSLHSACL